MRLQKIQVTNFRSVEDSGEFDVDPVTCLVGKNEAGKSAILLALAALNPNQSTPVTLDKERDYPRRNLTRYEQIHKGKDAVAISTIWELDDKEMVEIAEDVGKGVMTSHQVEVSRCYERQIEVRVQLDYSASLKHHYDLFLLSASERSTLRSPKTTDELLEVLKGLETPTEKHVKLRDFLNEKGGALRRVKNHVIGALPSFMYVSSYDRMEGAIQIEETKQRIATEEIGQDTHRGARLFVDFLEYAGVGIDKIVNVPTYESFNALLQAASNDITERILEYWSQNPDLDVEVRIDNARPGDLQPFNQGTIARARIKNNLHRVDTPFSERSAGFVWFFSFLVKFAQVKKAGGPVVLLLDEPGLSLHGKAQGDLLRFIDEKLAPYHQVIYSTHSPFMVPADKLQRVRIVEDKVAKNKTPRRSYGTKVSKDFLKVESDTLFPLQGALGYEATQSLFVGEHTLLVEGPSEILYIQALSNELKARGMTSLDPRWTICPAGGIDKIMPFVSLFAGKKLHVAVLSDVAQGDKRKVDRIRKSDILQAGHFYTVADFIDAEEGDIEDLFDSEVYAEIVNNSYELQDTYQITVDELNQHTSTTRSVKKVEAMFNIMPDTIPTYDHFTPAAWLIRNPGFLKKESEPMNRTLSVAERIFKTFNGLF